MLERVRRDKISLLLDYYRDVGWISETVKSQIMTYARGELQDVTKYDVEHENDDLLAGYEDDDLPEDYKKVTDWRLSAEDHLKSLLFLKKMAGQKL
jgi:flagellar protein FlaD